MKTILTLVFALSPALFAQGSGSSAPPSYGASGGGLEHNFTVTKTVNATITDITPNVIVVKEVNKKGVEKVYEVRYDAKMRVSADKKTEIGMAKKKLTHTDLAVGQFVRITGRADDQVAVDVRIIPAKKA
ncbi:MAG: hypothetical protein NW208_06665 [Bryobacter sp.]|nr:hypothetical protein [Bryobacter sp.]